PQAGRRLYMAAQYVLASSDSARTWRVISPDLARPPGAALPADPAGAPTGVGAPAAGGSITSLAPSPVAVGGRGVIWVGSSTGFIHVTRDGGQAWAHVTTPNTVAGSINVIDASHHDAGTAYAAILSNDRKPHIYRTLNFGSAWQEISTGLADDGTARVVREDPVDANLLYAGTVTSAYVSVERRDHWQPLQLNLPNTPGSH